MDPGSKAETRTFRERFGPILVVGPSLLVLFAAGSTCFLPTRGMVEKDVRRLEKELQACIARRCKIDEAVGLARRRGFRVTPNLRVVDQGKGRFNVWTAFSSDFPSFGPVRGYFALDLYPDERGWLRKVAVIESGTAL